VENIGCHNSTFNSRYYNSEQTIRDIRKALLNNLGTALTNMSGKETYWNVDVIQVVVKQLKGFYGFESEHAGTLTTSAVTAAKRICDEAAGSNSLLTERKDSTQGSVYIGQIGTHPRNFRS